MQLLCSVGCGPRRMNMLLKIIMILFFLYLLVYIENESLSSSMAVIVFTKAYHVSSGPGWHSRYRHLLKT